MIFVIGLAAFAVSGCATTSQQSPLALTSVYGIEKVQPSPAANMDWMEKTGYYVGWLALESAYAFAAGDPAFSP